MQHALDMEVIDISAPSAEEPNIFLSWNRSSNERIHARSLWLRVTSHRRSARPQRSSEIIWKASCACVYHALSPFLAYACQTDNFRPPRNVSAKESAELSAPASPAPQPRSLSRSSAMLKTADDIAEDSVFTIGFGVPAGAKTSKPGDQVEVLLPKASSTVGTSGNDLIRFGEATAKGRTEPDLRNGCSPIAG